MKIVRLNGNILNFTLYPRSANSKAALSPARPPPITRARRVLPAGSLAGSLGFLGCITFIFNFL